MTDYASVRRTLTAMGEGGFEGSYSWGCHPDAAAHAAKHLDELEAKQIPHPLLLGDGDGSISLVWNLSNWKIYRTFEISGETWDHFSPGKDSRIIDYRGAIGGGNLPELPMGLMKLSPTHDPDAYARGLRDAASVAHEHTPEKHSGATLASHVTGRSIEAAILALVPQEPKP